MDKLALKQPALASCYGASLSDRQLLGTEPGERTRKLVHPVRELSSADEGLAEVGGVNVHVGAAVGARDRPIAQGRGCAATWPDPPSPRSASK